MASRKMIMVVLSLALMSWTSAQAQTPKGTPDMSCIQALIPCANFLNSTKPPAACCVPLTKAFKTQLPCLCAAFTNPDIAQAANINMTQALELPVHCGLKADPSMCTKGNAKPPTSAPGTEAPTSAPAKEAPTPAAYTPKASTTPAGKSAASSVAWTGPVSGVMLLLAGLMFY